MIAQFISFRLGCAKLIFNIDCHSPKNFSVPSCMYNILGSLADIISVQFQSAVGLKETNYFITYKQ